MLFNACAPGAASRYLIASHGERLRSAIRARDTCPLRALRDGAYGHPMSASARSLRRRRCDNEPAHVVVPDRVRDEAAGLHVFDERLQVFEPGGAALRRAGRLLHRGEVAVEDA